ncbi:MAG: hypothetical protein V4613_13980 [Bacteroidota bacterium]
MLKSQGCSDAGACSLGAMPGSKDEIKSSLMMNLQFGVGEQGVRIITPQLEGVLKLNNKSYLQLKLPYVFANGNLGTNNNLGDITLIGSYKIKSKNNYQINVNAGFKLGVNDASHSKYGHFFAPGPGPLPMPYQTSLGTHDVLIGAGLKYKSTWNFGIAFQMPVYQFNKNNFDTAIAFSNSGDEKQYFSSYHLFRRPDAVIRIDKSFLINKFFTATAGALAIYHLGHDRALTSSSNFKTDAAISGSKGLTLNIPVALSYDTQKHWSYALRFASPIIVRKVRPDGLTRHFVTALEIKYSF